MDQEVEISEADLAAAEERGRERLATEPRAASARYDRQAKRIIVDLTNGGTFAFSPDCAEDLKDGTPDQLSEIEVSPAGFALHWPAIDVDFSVAGLIAGRFGTSAFMTRSRRGGRSFSVAEPGAALPQGRMGGRPRRRSS